MTQTAAWRKQKVGANWKGMKIIWGQTEDWVGFPQRSTRKDPGWKVDNNQARYVV